MEMMTMRKNTLWLSTLTAMALLPTLTQAQEAATGATTGATTGAAPTTEAPTANGTLLAQADTTLTPVTGEMVVVPRALLEQLQRDVAELKQSRAAQGEMTMAPGSTGKAFTGWYAGASVGPQSRKSSVDVNATPQTAAIFDDGSQINGVLGYRLRNNIRLEFEATSLNNKNKTFITNTATGTNEPSVGNVGLRAYSANVYYDVPLKGKLSRFKPFFGGGYGQYQSSINGFTAPSLTANNIVLDTRSFETTLWQYRVGTSYALNDKTELTLNYRKFLGTLLKFRFDVPPAPGLVVPLNVTGGNTKGFEVGFRAFF